MELDAELDHEVPASWRRTPLGHLITRPATYGVVKAGSFIPDGVPMLRGGDIKMGQIAKNLPCISIEKSAEYSRTLLRDGDVVISLVGYPGEAAVVTKAHEGANISRAVGLLRPGPELDSHYLAAYLNSPLGRREFLKPGAGSAQLVVNLRDLNLLSIPIPGTLAEQRAIAGALSDADAWVASLERLIAKKRRIKLGAMQDLLTARRRLPGFKGKWETRRLRELGVFSKGRGIKRDEVAGEGLACIRYGELYTRYENYVFVPVSRIPRWVADKALPIRKGDILFAGSGETADEIGRCAAYLGGEEAFAGGDIIVFSPHGQDSMFLAHLLNSPMVARQKAKMGQGDAIVHIHARSLEQVELLVPQFDEQQAIAAVLSDMDVEITSLEAKLTKARRIKQGMMQQLLTGQVRLVEPEPGAEPAIAGDATQLRQA